MTDFLDSATGSEHGEGGSDLSQSCYANAQRCRDAWATHYDIQTNQMFYFNVLTGSRQLHMPNALLSPLVSEEAEELKASLITPSLWCQKQTKPKLKRKLICAKMAIKLMLLTAIN